MGRVKRGRIRIGATLAAAARVYGEQARILLPAALVVFAPIGLLGVLIGDVELDPANVDLATGVLLSLEATAQFAALALGEVFFVGVVVAVVSEARTGERRPTLGALVRRLPWGRLIAADLIITLGVGLGFIILIVPGVVFLVYFGLAAPLIEIEDLRVGPALRRSRNLVRGHFWPILLLVGGSYFGSTVVSTIAEEGDLLPLEHSLLADWITVVALDVALTPPVALVAAVAAYELKRLEEDDEEPAPVAV